MKFEVYCDEANPDALTSANPRTRHLMIGSLWLPEDLRDEIKARIGALRQRHQAWGEIKRSKVSPNRKDFYVELMDLFVGYGDNLRFRCIAIDRTQLNLKKQRPQIRYAGSAAETSIGSKPIGSELENECYSGRCLCQVWPPLGSVAGLLDIQEDIPETRAVEPGRYAGLPSKKSMTSIDLFLQRPGDSNDNIEPGI